MALGSAILLASFPSYAAGASCNGAVSQLSQASQAIEKGNVAEAERILGQLGLSYEQCHELALVMGRLKVAEGDLFSAQKLFSLYCVLAPKDPRGHYHLSRLLFTQGNYPRADLISQSAVSLDPNYIDALVLRGRILLMKGQIDQAEELLKKACQVSSDNAEAHFELGRLYDSNHQSLEAVTHFERAVTLNPRDPRAYDYLGLNLEALGEIGRAETAFKKGLQVNQQPLFDAFLDYNYGRFLMTQNRLAEARTHLDRALELAPKARAVHYEHAKLNLRLKNYEEARRDAERALSLSDPGGFVLDLQVYYQLATVYSRLGKQELADKYSRLSQTTSVPIKGYKMRK
jgi:protein O-GlcNAc transferase